MDETLRLGMRLALVWSAGFVVALLVRMALPSGSGVTLTGHETTLFVPYNRIGFWTCMLAALTVTALVVVRAAAADIGWQTLK